jgi:plasmid stability protein
MADIKVRNLDDAVADVLRARADRNGRSLEAEVRATLTESALAARERFAERTHVLREAILKRRGGKPTSSSVSDIRAERDKNG